MLRATVGLSSELTSPTQQRQAHPSIQHAIMMSSNDSTGNPIILNSMFSVEDASVKAEGEGPKPGYSSRASVSKPTTICGIIPLSWILLPDDGGEIHIKNSDISTVFLLLNYMIGSGIVVQAYAFSQSGIIVIIFEYIVISILNYVGVNLLILCAEETKIFDYSQVAESILGVNGGRLVDISIFFGGFGSLLSYILVVGSLLTGVAEHCPGWFCSVEFLTLIPLFLVTVPLCLLRKFGHLAIASYISIAVIGSIVLLVIIGGPAQNPHAVSNVRLGNFLGSTRTIGDVVFALGYITATFHSYNAMENRNINSFNTVAKTTMGLGAMMCFFTGLAGYLSFGDDTKSNILENFSGPLGGVFKTALVIHLLLYIPGDFVIMRDSILKLAHVDVNTMSDFSFISFSLICLGVITLVALLLQMMLSSTDSLAIVVDITGGICGSMLYFVIPALCAMKLFYNDRNVFWRSVLLLFFGMAIIACVFVSVSM